MNATVNALQQQALAAPKVRLLEQADWYRGLDNAVATTKGTHVLVQEQDVIHGVLPATLARFGGSSVVNGTMAVALDDLLVGPTATGYHAMVMEINACFTTEKVYCAAPLFGIWVQPLGMHPPALLPQYLAWWLNWHQKRCAGPEALLQSCIPLPPIALQRQLLMALPSRFPQPA